MSVIDTSLGKVWVTHFDNGDAALWWPDRARVLAGKPPVPITRALGAIASHCPPLARTETIHA